MHTDLAMVQPAPMAALPASKTPRGLSAARALVGDPPPSRALSPENSPEIVVPAAHGAALLLALRASEAYLYPNPFAQIGPERWARGYRDSVTRPPLFDRRERAFEWDRDHWTLNVVGHGLLGAELYYRPRRCGWSPLGALAFTAGATVAWEYGFEANGVRPSALDLVYTPLAGILLGEGRYWGMQLLQSVGNRSLRTIASVLLDPFGELERAAGAVC